MLGGVGLGFGRADGLGVQVLRGFGFRGLGLGVQVFRV